MIDLLLGHALTQLRTIETGTVDMAITSPPYYGLRNYSTTPVIWNALDGCNHRWGETIPPSVNKAGNYIPSGIEQTNRAHDNGAISQARDVETGGQFCQFCNAWRGELGSEPTVELFIRHLADIFDEVYRVLKSTGSCWINIADTYAATRWSGKGEGQPINKMRDGHRDINPTKGSEIKLIGKSQLCVPERLVLEMISRGWAKRNTIVWHKPSCLPSSAKDRFTVDFEYLFFFVKQEKYYFEQQLEPYSDVFLNDKRHTQEIPLYNSKYPDNIQGGCKTRNNIFESGLKEGRNKRAVWSINPARSSEAHFATFPEELIITPIKAGSPKGGTVLDVFMGSGTAGKVCKSLDRDFIGIELNPEYMEMAKRKIFPLQQTIFDKGD